MEYPRQPAAKEDPFELKDLQRTRGLMEAIRLSLLEIERMKEGKHDKSFRLNVNRLKKQQTARLNQASPEALHIVEEQAYLDATVKTIKTLNSIRALFPLLVRMFHHDDVRNQTLEMTVSRNEEGEITETTTLAKLNEPADKKAKKKKGPQKSIWLLGDYVYDTSRAGQFRAFNESLWRILECILPDERQISQLQDMKDVGETFWKRLLPDFIQDQTVRRQVPSPNKLFASLPLEQQEEAVAIAKACDEKYLNVFHHENEDTQEARVLYQAAVDKLINNLRMAIQKRFRDAELRVYGSCLSNLALGKSSDVDLSLHLPAFARLKHLFEIGEIEAKKFEYDTKSYVYRISDTLASKSKSSNGFQITDCVTRARVPVIKGKYLYANNPYSLDGTLDFDICFSNEIAVVNSALLSEYTLIDERVKTFLLTIKAWAKLNKISSAADARISSYAWVNLGIFYLQCIGFVPNLQCRELMANHGFERDPENWSHCANDLDTCFLPWDIVAKQNDWFPPEELKDTPVTLLMYGFFDFYAKYFPKMLFAVSIREGGIKLPKATFEKVSVQIPCIEDPFETHCSHTPHDLSRPAGEAGHVVIAKALNESEEFLRNTLTGGEEDTESDFWKMANVASPERNILSPSRKKTRSDSGKGQQNTNKDRLGGKGGHDGKGRGKRGQIETGDEISSADNNEGKAVNGHHNRKKKAGKKRANNPHQKNAAMQPPNINGVKNLSPNNDFQGKAATKRKESLPAKGGDSGQGSRHSKKQTPEQNGHDGFTSPKVEEGKDSNLDPSSGEKNRRKNPFPRDKGKPGRGGRRSRRYRSKKKGVDDSKDSKKGGSSDKQEAKTNRVPMAEKQDE